MEFNFSKSDKLLFLEAILNFFCLQREIVSKVISKNKLIEDYLTIFPKLATDVDFDYLGYKEIM